MPIDRMTVVDDPGDCLTGTQWNAAFQSAFEDNIDAALADLAASIPEPFPMDQHLLFEPDNTYDIGASGANRPRNIFVGGNVLIAGAMNLGGALAGSTSQWSGLTVVGGGSLENVGVFLEKGIIAPPAMSGTNHNYNPANLAIARILMVNGGAAFVITGIVAQPAGRRLTVMNYGSGTCTLNYYDAGSTDVNRIITPRGVALALGTQCSADLIYSQIGVAGAWRVMAAAV